MAGFAAWNAVSLLLVVLLGQQRSLVALRRRLLRDLRFRRIWWKVIDVSQGLQQMVLSTLRSGAPVIAAILVLLAGAWQFTDGMADKPGRDIMPWRHLQKGKKEMGGFYTGIYAPDSSGKLQALEQNAELDFSIISLYQAWGPRSLT